MPQSKWFVLHTLSGQEQKVKDSIEKRIKAEEMGEYINEVLALNNGNRTKTARDLGVDPRTVFRHLEKESDDGELPQEPM